MSNFSFLDNIKFRIPAGESLPLPAGNWDYLYMAELSGGDLLAEGSGLRLPFILGRQIRTREKEVGTILLTNRGVTTAEGVIYAGSGDVEDRAMVGSVSITGPVTVANPEEMHAGNVALTDAGGEFVGASSVAPGVGQYGAVQLFNPVASGKRIVIKEAVIVIPNGEAGACYFRRHNTAVTASVSSGVNKLDGSASDAEVRTDVGGSIIGGDSYGFRSSSAYEKNQVLQDTGDSPLVIGEGEGVVLNFSVPNAAVYGSFNWSEVAL